MADPDELVTLAVCGYQEAVLLRSLLLGEGIEVFLPDQHAFNNVLAAVFNLTVMVKQSDLPRAQELLETLRRR